MLISKLLKINEDLSRIDMSNVQQATDQQRDIISSVINTHGLNADLVCHINTINDSIIAINEIIQTTKTNNTADINELSPQYAANSYRKYETDLKYADAHAHRTDRASEPHPKTKKIIQGRIGTYIDWRYPGLEIGPGDGVWTRSLVGCDPLYIVDLHNEFLESTKHLFSSQYRPRLRTYKTDNYDLSMIPQNQIGFAFSWHTFNFFPMETIKNYLINVYKALRPGGVMMFSYNNCEMSMPAKMAEDGFMCYTPKSLLLDLIDLLGYELLYAGEEDSDISWVEIKKPGSLTSSRISQTLVKKLI